MKWQNQVLKLSTIEMHWSIGLQSQLSDSPPKYVIGELRRSFIEANKQATKFPGLGRIAMDWLISVQIDNDLFSSFVCEADGKWTAFI